MPKPPPPPTIWDEIRTAEYQVIRAALLLCRQADEPFDLASPEGLVRLRAAVHRLRVANTRSIREIEAAGL